jgi:hypothetical protein
MDEIAHIASPFPFPSAVSLTASFICCSNASNASLTTSKPLGGGLIPGRILGISVFCGNFGYSKKKMNIEKIRMGESLGRNRLHH